MKADYVLEGGGTRGIAYPSAIGVFEAAGWEPQQVAGTSAGAIVAGLMACGARAKDLLDILSSTDFRKFVDRRPWRGIWDTWHHLGLCRGDAFERWFESLVGDVTVSETHLPLTVFAVDAQNRETLRFSRDSYPNLSVAAAVRCSMSIPLFFRAVQWTEIDGTHRVVVDGGMTDNFPIECFDVHDRTPRWPTIGFLLDEVEGKPKPIRNVIDHGLALLSLSRVAPQKRLTAHNAYRTVQIADGGVSWLNFALSEAEKASLVENGRMAAESFLARWEASGGFDGYVQTFRGGA